MNDNRPAIVLEESIAQWRGCWGYVENVAAAITLAVTDERASNRVYHVAEPEVLCERERIGRIWRLVGWQGNVVAVPKNQMPAEWMLPFNTKPHWFVDTTRIRQELNYSEVVSLDEAFKLTQDFQLSHPPQENSPWAAPYLLDYATEDAILAGLKPL